MSARVACHRIRRLISAYVDGELAEALRASIGAHCRTCEPCRCELEAAQELRVQIRDLEIEEPGLSEGWEAALAARVAMVDDELNGPHATPTRRSPPWIATVALAASLLLGLGLGLWLSRTPLGSSSRQLDPLVTASDTTSTGERGPGLVDYHPQPGSLFVEPASVKAPPEVGSFVQDTFVFADAARQAPDLPGESGNEKVAFLQGLAELQDLPGQARRMRQRVEEVHPRPLSRQVAWITLNLEEVLGLLSGQGTHPEVVLDQVASRTPVLAEEAISLARYLQPPPPRTLLPGVKVVRQQRLPLLFREGYCLALGGQGDPLRMVLDQMRCDLPPDDPFLQRMERLWPTIAALRGNCLEELGPEALIFVITSRPGTSQDLPQGVPQGVPQGFRLEVRPAPRPSGAGSTPPDAGR